MQLPHDTNVSERQSAGLFDSIKNLAASLVAHLHTRLALFSNELAEEKVRLIAILSGALLMVFFLFMGLVLVATFIVAAAWDSPYRLHIVGGLAIAFFLISAIAAGYVHARLKSGPRPFAMSLAELYKDKQALSSQ